MKLTLLIGDSWPRPLRGQVPEKVTNRLPIEIGLGLAYDPSAKIGTIEILAKAYQNRIGRRTIQVGCRVGWWDVAKRGTVSSRIWPTRVRISCIGSVTRIAVRPPINAWRNHVASVELIGWCTNEWLSVHDVGWSGISWHSGIAGAYCRCLDLRVYVAWIVSWGRDISRARLHERA